MRRKTYDEDTEEELDLADYEGEEDDYGAEWDLDDEGQLEAGDLPITDTDAEQALQEDNARLASALEALVDVAARFLAADIADLDDDMADDFRDALAAGRDALEFT